MSVLFLPRTIPVLVTAFLLFRLFDIWKPFPARQFQELHGGLGVMLDDLIAGAYALALIAISRALVDCPGSALSAAAPVSTRRRRPARDAGVRRAPPG